MTNKINILLVLISLFLAFVQVMLLNRESTSGERLTAIRIETENLSQENERLIQVIASDSSMLAISAKAQLLGLEVSPSVVSLASPLPIAARGNFSL